MQGTERYVALLRGINVGGHHKVPMQELRKNMAKWGFKNVVTVLNSGNVIFDATTEDPASLAARLSTHLENTCGFPLPVIVRKAQTFVQLYDDAPFQDVQITKDLRLYVSFLKTPTHPGIQLPWTSPDNAFTITGIRDHLVLSILDISISQTPKAMEALEKLYGKDITTRNWNTIERIVKKLYS